MTGTDRHLGHQIHIGPELLAAMKALKSRGVTWEDVMWHLLDCREKLLKLQSGPA